MFGTLTILLIAAMPTLFMRRRLPARYLAIPWGNGALWCVGTSVVEHSLWNDYRMDLDVANDAGQTHLNCMN